MKTLIFVLLLLIVLPLSAQTNINEYKYILIPKKFEFSKSEDQYQLNSILKFLFNKYGFEAYFVDEVLPEDLKNNRCSALKAQVSKDKSGLFTTKLEIILNDCNDVHVVTSTTGESKLKAYDRAYVQALRQAFTTFKEIDYHYVDNSSITMHTGEENQTKKEVKPILDSDENKAENDDSHISKEKSVKEQKEIQILYAQAIDGGYQLVDAEPKIVMVLLNSGVSNVYIVKGKDAIVFKEDDFWYYSENNGMLKERKQLKIKF